jgi:hypothetical protein
MATQCRWLWKQLLRYIPFFTSPYFVSPNNIKQPSLTTFIPEGSTFTSEAVATEPAIVIATESTRFQGNQTAIAIGTIGTNTRVNSPVFTGGATDNVGSGKVYGVIGAAAVGFVIGIL